MGVGRDEFGGEAIALAFVGGLVAWYAGGSSALDRVLDIGPIVYLTVGVAVFTVVIDVGRGLLGRHPVREVINHALLLGVACALLGCTVAALINRHFDGGQGRTERATLTAFTKPTKGPRMASFARLSGSTPEHFRVQASVAEGCQEGSSAELDVRPGFLGMPWIAGIRCSERP